MWGTRRPVLGTLATAAALAVSLVPAAAPTSAAGPGPAARTPETSEPVQLTPDGVDTGDEDTALVDGVLFFPAGTEATGPELWRTDGTPGGTEQVANIRDDADVATPGSQPSDLVALDGAVFFAADDGATGPELWRSDGTEAGTEEVADLTPGSQSDDLPYVDGGGPRHLTAAGDRVYFSARGTADQRQLFVTDGTEAGTTPISETADGVGLRFPSSLTPVDDGLAFVADGEGVGRALFVTDGTEAGTRLWADPYDGPDDGFTSFVGLTSFRGELLFTAATADRGYDLYTSDGTPEGLQRLGDGFSAPNPLVVAGDQVFFRAESEASGGELWRTDGTDAGTRLVRDIRPARRGDRALSSAPLGLVAVGSSVFFSAAPNNVDRTLWTSDGTRIGTRQVADQAVGAAPERCFCPGDLARVGDDVVLTGSYGDSVAELLASDGTARGTVLAADLSPGRGEFTSTLTAAVDQEAGRYYFYADTAPGFPLWALTVADLPDLVEQQGPGIDGTARVGRRLTADPGAVDDPAATPSYQWYRGADPVPDAERRRYRLTGDDRGSRMSVLVTWNAADRDPLVARSGRTGTVRAR